MRSTEVYRVSREVLAPWCKAQGFRRARSALLGWYKSADDQYLAFWLRVSQEGWDPYAGSKFTVELQLSERPELGYGLLRLRLLELLTDLELAEVWRMQNLVIAKLGKPPTDYRALHIDDDVREWYLQKFEPVAESYTRSDDTWLRYADEEDVRMWAQFLLRSLPGAVERFHQWTIARTRDDHPSGP